MTKLRLPFFWSEQGLESGRKTQGSYSGYKINTNRMVQNILSQKHKFLKSNLDQMQKKES
jgi:hypothetical protein